MSTLKGRAGGYLRDAPGGINLEKIAVYAALGFGLYTVYKVYRGGKAVSQALTNAGSAIGTGLYDFLHPDADARATSTTYAVWFPAEKMFHAVDSLDVDKDGLFRRLGTRYRMGAPKTTMKAPDGRIIYRLAIPW